MLEIEKELSVEILDETFVLLPERAVFWPAEHALFCSDLHWGRESYLQSRGYAVPEVAFESESVLLTELVRKHQARELWILGDFIHHPAGVAPALRERIGEWSRKLGARVIVIPGNHDRGISAWASDAGLELAPDGLVRRRFEFQHEGHRPGAEAVAYTWSGHLHASARIPELFGHRKLPCFWLREKEAFLPAFSRLAGGADIGELHVHDRIFAIHGSEIFRADRGQ